LQEEEKTAVVVHSRLKEEELLATQIVGVDDLYRNQIDKKRNIAYPPLVRSGNVDLRNNNPACTPPSWN